jgi:hypothetical protein
VLRTLFRRYQGHWIQFYARDSFSTIPRASGPVFIFCASELIFDITDGAGYYFHVLRSRTRFPRYRGRRVEFSCFALQDSFCALPRVSVLLFLFCTPVLIFDGTECVESGFHISRSRTRFRRYRGHRVPFSCFAFPGRVSFSCIALPDSFSTVPSASSLVFMFCAPRLVLGCTEGVEYHFHVLCSQTRFRWYRECRVPFSCYALSVSFLAVQGASCPVFLFCAPGLIFVGTEEVGSRFDILRSRTHFRRYRGRCVQTSCFEFPYPFWALPRASGPVFMFYALGLILGGTECVGSHFRYRWRRAPIFMFCAP